MTTKTASVAEARNNFSKLAENVSLTGDPIVVFRHSKPWVQIAPLNNLAEGFEDAEFIEAMDDIIAQGLAAYEKGNYIVGVDAARAEVEKRMTSHA